MRIFHIILFCFFSLASVAQQSRSDLEKRRENILQAIRETQEQLELTRKDKNATLAELRALQSKLAERQKLIGNINQEISAINQNIQYSAKEIEALRQNLDMLKVRYAQSVRYAYKNRASYNMLAFLFSSNDFNEAIRRLKYLKKYRDHRKEQAEQIRVTHKKIEHKIDVLNSEKSQKDILRKAEEQQRLAVQREASETDKVVRELKGREKDLSKQIEKNRKATRQVDLAIQKVIQREIELARKKAEEEDRRRQDEENRRMMANRGASGIGVSGSVNTPATASSTNKPMVTSNESRPVASNVAKPTTSYINNLTPEVAALSANFESNRGKLPWPVEKGFISQSFGKYRHPVEEKVMLENNGVDITTNPGMSVRSVFAGVVSSSFS
ncbi:MAG TPA: hypothetical protein PL009_05980, partial [Flavipsychrobacter sp.]|nr:hypothetical protein [Flavipsychrobacter sp.]